MSTKPKIEIRDRIRELRRVPASELIPNLKIGAGIRTNKRSHAGCTEP